MIFSDGNMNEILKFFAKYIEENLGIIYNESNSYQLQNRLEQLVTQFSLSSLDDLYTMAQTGFDVKFKQALLDISTNNETFFFRDSALFTLLREEIFPKCFEELPSGQNLKIWCAASSTGQEPYSLAMILDEDFAYKTSMQGGLKKCIMASDISSRVLERAIKGKYSSLEVNRGLSENQIAKYFVPNANPNLADFSEAFELKDQIKSYVSFQKQNLLDSFVLLPVFDLILCRNVLIYQELTSKIKIVQKISGQLRSGGFLILGAAENLMGLSEDFEQMVGKSGAIYFRKK